MRTSTRHLGGVQVAIRARSRRQTARRTTQTRTLSKSVPFCSVSPGRSIEPLSTAAVYSTRVAE
eukprot:7391729-Prymnesium_polylepis.1